ncbi:MAG: DNA polymerase III, partial [Magnetospirillum sp.]
MSSSAIPPAPPPPPAQSKAAAGAVLTMVAGSGAEALAKLPAGSMVSVAVQAAVTKALIQVVTSSGTSLELKLPPNLLLPPDAELTLQLVQQGGLPALKLLAVNGRPLAAGAVLAGGLLSGGLLLPDAAELLTPGAAAPPPGRGGAVTLADPTAQTAGQPAAGPLGLTATVLRPVPAGAVMVP